MQFVDFHRMFGDQADLQEALYGMAPAEFDEQRKLQYVKDMTLALFAEAAEMLQEVQWKPWSSRQGEISRDAYVGECIDMLQFVMNLFAVVHATPEEIQSKLARKHGVNRQRIIDGYDNAEKCPVCKRALDDVTTECTYDRCAHSLVGPHA
jgi:hypothetical protein